MPDKKRFEVLGAIAASGYFCLSLCLRVFLSFRLFDLHLLAATAVLICEKRFPLVRQA